MCRVILILIVTVVEILETEAWVNNTSLQTLQMIVNATKAKECWIRTSLPKGGLVTPLYGVASQNWNYLDDKWTTWPDFWKKPDYGGGYCLFDNKIYELGPRFDLQILSLTTTIFMESDNNCHWKAQTRQEEHVLETQGKILVPSLMDGMIKQTSMRYGTRCRSCMKLLKMIYHGALK